MEREREKCATLQFNKDLHHIQIDAANRTPAAVSPPPIISNLQDIEHVESLYGGNSKNVSKNNSKTEINEQDTLEDNPSQNAS